MFLLSLWTFWIISGVLKALSDDPWTSYLLFEKSCGLGFWLYSVRNLDFKWAGREAKRLLQGGLLHAATL